MNDQSLPSGFTCVSCGRLVVPRRLGEGGCPCCEHITWLTDDYDIRLASVDQNSRIMVDLRSGLNILLTRDKPLTEIADLIVPYIADMRRLDSHYEEPESWRRVQPRFVPGKLDLLRSISSRDDLPENGYGENLVAEWWDAFCAYADHRVRIEMLPEDEIRAFFRDFYYARVPSKLPNLYEFAFSYVLHDIIDNKNQDADLLTRAITCLESHGVDWFSVLVLEYLDRKEAALRFIARDLRAGRLGTGTWSERYRSKMHSLGAKQVLGWCPCSECSSSRRTGAGKRSKKRGS